MLCDNQNENQDEKLSGNIRSKNITQRHFFNSVFLSLITGTLDSSESTLGDQKRNNQTTWSHIVQAMYNGSYWRFVKGSYYRYCGLVFNPKWQMFGSFYPLLKQGSSPLLWEAADQDTIKGLFVHYDNLLESRNLTVSFVPPQTYSHIV